MLKTKTKILNIVKSRVWICLIIAFMINIIIESFGRRSISGGLLYLKEQPLVFTYNTLLIWLTMSIALFLRHRILALLFVSAGWLLLGITNGIMLGFRTTPFTAIDLLELKAALLIMDKYLSSVQIILVFVGIFAAIALIIVGFIFIPRYKDKIKYKRNIVIVILLIICFFGLTKACFQGEVLSRHFGNLAYAYKDYGTPYCFMVTMLDTGIKMPNGYTKVGIKKAKNANHDEESPIKITDEASALESKDKPNIIFVQLESFFDPTLVEELKFSKDPVPNFRKLLKDYSSGYLNVPVVGAGTCNTEFEVITGMNLGYFGPGEYPYKTILNKTTAESMAYNLSSIGYITHAMHNNDGTFYGRNKIFSQLGFDTFTSIEYMENVDLNPRGWAKDKVLINEILKTMNSTIEQDLIYAISVQGHGSYPTTVIDENQTIKIDGINNEGKLNAFEYYANQINEMDDFIGKLIEELSKQEENVVLVLYGDHLPGLGIDKSSLESKSIFKTQYVIWDNFNLVKDDVDLEAYQLSSAVFAKVGINNGTLINFHQNNMGSKTYKKYLKLLQYDMLYGKRYVYKEENPYIATDIEMGVSDIVIKSIHMIEDEIIISGDNFTEYSTVIINGDAKDTIFADNNTLRVKNYTLNLEDEVVISQSGSDRAILSSSKIYEYQ